MEPRAAVGEQAVCGLGVSDVGGESQCCSGDVVVEFARTVLVLRVFIHRLDCENQLIRLAGANHESVDMLAISAEVDRDFGARVRGIDVVEGKTQGEFMLCLFVVGFGEGECSVGRAVDAEGPIERGAFEIDGAVERNDTVEGSLNGAAVVLACVKVAIRDRG
jgi:hypothetical protein